MGCSLPGSSVQWNFLGKNTGVDSHDLLQGIFPTQSLNLSLLHHRWIFYCWATGEDPMQSTVVQSHSCVQPFVTSQTATRHACLSLIISWSLPKFMSIAPVIPSSHLILWCPFLLLPSISASIRDFFPKSWLFTSADQNTGASASASVLPMSIQGWFPWRLTGLISLLSKGLSVVFSRTTVWRHQTLPSLQTFCMWLYWLTTVCGHWGP